MLRIGVDLGGTKIEIIALTDDGVLLRHRIATPDEDYRAILDALAGLVRDCEAKLGQAGTVGIGTPGFDLARDRALLRGSNSVCLNGKPIRADSRGAARPQACEIANDANCFALSEATDGARCEAPRSSSASSSAPVWAPASSCAARCSTGPNAIAGEWGHNRCRGRATTNGRATCASAGTAAASKPCCPARASSAIISRLPASSLSSHDIAGARGRR